MSTEHIIGPQVIEHRVHWVHTGIEAPFLFSAICYPYLETPRGVAFTAKLVHPQRGVVGQIHNSGNGGPTTFHAEDKSRFSEQDLETFLRRSLQDGEPMSTGFSGIEHLLEEIITETETAQTVAMARGAHDSVIRSFAPKQADTGYGPYRGVAMRFSRILVHRSTRRRLADELATNPDHRLYEPGAFWQLFDNEKWIDLLGPDPLPEEKVAARFDALDHLRGSAPDTGWNRKQLRIDGVRHHVTGDPAGQFWLLTDKKSIGDLSTWCWCSPRRSARTAPFELWNGRVLEATGLIHADSDCRRLVRID
ncbi:hypothetical protein [Actinokineospora iranica]|uniref:Uncharacterized protein n=1 Tax=Actinokineospora iranica TaxID=1271860 RepID=A0A1G6VQT7_9PSEU|nr:hypothetical protein [Actinokineospora iranica]SDD55225.1 hypothetical protein SAMN05216174_11316 [Actinokineospora iranica]